MAKRTIEEEINALIAAGNARRVENKDNLWKDAQGNDERIRGLENLNDPLEVGDIIEIPENYEVIESKIADNFYPCAIVIVHSTDGSERNMQLFPNSLAKSCQPVDEKNHRLPRAKTSGAVAVWAQEQGTKANVMNNLRGKKIRVAAVQAHTIFNNRTQTRSITYIYQYEWA